MNLFSVEDCEYIKKIYFDYDEVDGHQHHDFGVVSIRFRKENSAKFVVIEDTKICNFVFEKVKNFIPNLKQVTNLKIMKYDKGDSLAKHQDFNRYGVEPTYKTILIQLSNPNDYDGGNLIVKDIVQSREQGSISIIKPTDEHEVTKITRGTRFSLVLFLKDVDFVINKSFI